jgi:hypothetical protein
LERQGPKYTSGFLSADGTEESTYQGKRYVQKKRREEKREQGIRKYLSRSTSSPHLRLGGLRRMKGRTTERVNNVNKYRKKKYMEQVYLFP